MYFRLRRDTEDWFKHILDQKPIDTKFDLFYLCLMIGFATGRASPPSKQGSGVTDIVDNFVTSYRPMQRLIIGLLLVAEVSRLGLDLSEKEEVTQQFDDLVDPTSPTNLTETAMSRMNEYASGGFDYLAEQYEARPYHVEEFLQTYVKLLRQEIDKNPNWKNFIKPRIG
jgi:hypothetical protein